MTTKMNIFTPYVYGRGREYGNMISLTGHLKPGVTSPRSKPILYKGGYTAQLWDLKNFVSESFRRSPSSYGELSDLSSSSSASTSRTSYSPAPPRAPRSSPCAPHSESHGVASSGSSSLNLSFSLPPEPLSASALSSLPSSTSSIRAPSPFRFSQAFASTRLLLPRLSLQNTSLSRNRNSHE
jgi:hypothetical protein